MREVALAREDQPFFDQFLRGVITPEPETRHREQE